MVILRSDDPVAVVLLLAIRGGDVGELARVLGENGSLAAARIERPNGTQRTPLHVACDWPGYFPNGADVVRMLIEAGAEPSTPTLGGPHAETPLHWAASSDDVDVATALIDGGADLEAPGASIAGGAPLDDAVGYGCWHVARLLVDRGVRVDRLWHAAALGMRGRLQELLGQSPSPTSEDIDEAFWQACHGGQRRAADFLLSRGANINAVPGYAEQTPLDIAGSLDTRRDTMVEWLRRQGATSASA